MDNRFLLLTERNKKEVLNYLPPEKSINRLADYFQNFSDGTRLKIISCLAMCDMCVNDISRVLQINQTTISHQLKYLKNQNIVTSKRDGKIILYKLSNRKVNELMLSAVNAV
jgi:ArsR family transcriptional regulator